MTLDKQILETIQQIAGIFQTKNIASAPVNIEYLDEVIAPGMEKYVVSELIMHLKDLLIESLHEEQKVHRFSRYVDTFENILIENSDGGSLIGKNQRIA